MPWDSTACNSLAAERRFSATRRVTALSAVSPSTRPRTLRTVYVKATSAGSYQITANLLDASQPANSPFVATDSLVTRFQKLVGQVADATNSAINKLLADPKTKSFIIDKIAGQLKSMFAQLSEQIDREVAPDSKLNVNGDENAALRSFQKNLTVDADLCANQIAAAALKMPKGNIDLYVPKNTPPEENSIKLWEAAFKLNTPMPDPNQTLTPTFSINPENLVR